MIGPRQAALARFHPAPRRAGSHRALVFAAAAIVSLTVAGCGRDGPLAPAPGSGSLTATGALNLSGTGPADFRIMGDRQPTFGLEIDHFLQRDLDWELQIYKNNSGQLGVGTYNLGPPSESLINPTAFLAYNIGGKANPLFQTFNSTSGQLVITSSSPLAVRGTFAFTGTELGGTGSVTVNGSFYACSAVC
jgi:hypothetical protein